MLKIINIFIETLLIFLFIFDIEKNSIYLKYLI